MITLFHGSYISVDSPLVKLGRTRVDFGQGFYLTKLRDQAQSWAETIAERRGRGFLPILSSYTFDFESVKAEGYRIKYLNPTISNGFIT